MNKILLVIIILIVLAVVFSFYNKKEVGDKDMGDSYKYGTLLAEYEKELDSLPRDLRKRILRSIRKSELVVLENEKELMEEFPDSGLLPFIFSSDIELFDGLENGHSVRVSNYEYTGGAHGNTYFESYNVVNGDDVSLSSIIKRPFDEVKNEIRVELESREGVGGEFLEEGLDRYQSFDDFETWNIKRGQDGVKVVVITFPLYTVASFSSGVQSVEVLVE